ncbi:MAG: acetyl-CoA carboxylase biotin carboxylase subunit [Bacteroidetes bacterium]|nr:acetyl-CoA carboxylase biotin carboxylase subunit [Bacteroidota bacterium]MBT5531006.1 acetyl-CoA carboxylase biotin carboxylase subunit [Cytophagia bacterium]MBT3423805.1 acetyl-CoA carboxylase biotin carboxylase subunit [Bacteroidota bacterium]MBT3802845.1 acetyl-CoA carboxylase biotin carboxylase subunit [Bacteroidota bacterium]MBT3933465.1 acetyl-CoA carboxylase biotin carboxylase subunit [Bacteroidota bacterium]
MEKILVANRGEIALRVMRSAKEMGIKTVAIYSEVDRLAPHVRYANEAVCIGPAPSKDSYLRIDKILKICKDLKVDGIHPGYGFLSENAEFAKLVEAEGIKFIGPNPKAIEMMGNKLAAKDAVKDYNIPMVPGTDYAIGDIDEAKKIAAKIGFPILIKAAAGGGGKGMRIVEDVESFEEQMKLAVSEATNAFGDGSVFIEKYIASPRHIEIQILADNYGNIIHLNERECSIQRRHQKVIEEAPSAILTPEVRRKMGKAAIAVARACDYVGAGTVEFLVDDKLNFYFLEMNTRLQVEHPVTEYICHIDLVKEQIRIARGEELGYSQGDITIKGHAIEARIYAEDPRNNFLPAVGTLNTYIPPQGKGIRVDDGYEEGMEVSIYYDPLIAKLISFGKTRDKAIFRMQRAIEEYRISGVKTTLPFCRFVMEHEAFQSGNFDTHFVANYFNPDKMDKNIVEEQEIAALLAAKIIADTKNAKVVESISSDKQTSWKRNRS